MKRLLKTIFILLFGVLLFGCSAPGDVGTNNNETNNSVVIETSRKIVYTVDYSIEGVEALQLKDEIYDKVVSLNGYMASGEETFTSATIVYKVPTYNLDAFLDYIDSLDGVGSKIVNSNDITSQYSYVEARISTLKASKNAYLTLLQDSSLSRSDIIEINDKLDEIDTELITLNAQKAQYDNQLDYSKVTIKYNAKEKFINEYFTYLGEFFKGLGIAVLYMLPVLLVAFCIFSSIFFPIKLKNKRK